jgi:hypothetical protein
MSFESDDAVARELILFAENDGDIYRQTTQPILRNLATKKAQGKYDGEKAVQAFMYLAEAGARAYAKNFGSGEEDWHTFFPMSVRRAAATHWRDEFEKEFSLGNYDDLLPKKYQTPPKPSGTTKSRRPKRQPFGTWHSAGTEKERLALARDLMASVDESDPLARYQEFKYVAEQIVHGASLNTIIDLAENTLPQDAVEFIKDRTIHINKILGVKN